MVTSRNVDGAGKLEQNNLYYIRKRYCLQNKLIQFTVFEMLFFLIHEYQFFKTSEIFFYQNGHCLS